MERRPSGPLIVALVALALLVACGCAAGAGEVLHAVIAPREPSPLGGDGTVSALLACPMPLAETDGAVLRRRLEALALEHEVEVRDPTHLHVLLRNVADGALAHVLRPGVLELAEVLDGAVVVPPDEAWEGLSLQQRGAPGAATFHAATEAALGPLAARVPAGSRFVVSCDPRGDDPTPCEGMFVRLPAALGASDVEGAEVQVDGMSGEPQVLLAFTAEGGARFAQLTTALVRRRLAIVVDGRVLSAPIVQMPITGGSAVVTMGGADPTAGLVEAHALAAALDVGAPLGCAWEVEAIP
jgi:preprotein translocase subunit SecD